MKVIILAAGRGTRLEPISNTTPKPLIKICGKSILEHNLENIYKFVDEIIIVVKYLKEKIINRIGKDYKGIPIKYKIQGEEKGTAGALKGLEINDDIVVIAGDQIFEKQDIEKIFNLKGYGCLVTEVENPKIYGIFGTDKDGNAMSFVEKPEKFIGNLANISFYKFPKEIFKIIEKTQLSPRGEYELTDSIKEFIRFKKLKTIKITGNFIDIGYCWQILNANSYFLKNLKNSIIEGKIEENVTIKGKIILKKGSILKSGTYIEGNCYIGENSQIGPNTYLRGETCIGENCKIGNAVEIKNSNLGDNTNVAHLSYIGDSIIGNNVNIGGGFISANLRHDEKNIRVMIKGKLIDSGKRKLGVIIGDNVKTGIKTITMPGRIIENNSFTIPSEIVK